MGGVGEQLVDGADDGGHRAAEGHLDGADLAGAVGGHVDEHHLLGVGLGEGVGQRGARVAHGVEAGPHPLGAVEVAEGDVVEAVEELDADLGGAADGEEALGLRRLGPRHEGVGDHQAARGAALGPGPAEGLVEHAVVGAAGGSRAGGTGVGRRGDDRGLGLGVEEVEQRERLGGGAVGRGHRRGRHRRRRLGAPRDRAGGLDLGRGVVGPVGRGEHGVEVGHGHDVERAVGELEGGDRPGPAEAAADDHARQVGEPVVGGQALGAVVVAGDGHDPHPVGDQAVEGVAQQGHRLGGRDGPVVEVAGDHDEVDALGHHDLDQPVEERRLVGVERHGAEASPEVPVARVEDAHRLSDRRVPVRAHQ